MNKKKPERENLRPELFIWTVMCVSAIAVMQWFALNKTIVIADTPSELSVSGSDASKEEPSVQRRELRLEKTDGGEGSFCIPLPKGTREENITMENRYADGELWLYIRCGDEAFSDEASLTGDTDDIRSGTWEAQGDGVLLRLKMRRIMEYRSAIEGNNLVVACYEPGELYEYVVVLDPAGGGVDAGLTKGDVQEKDVAFAVARQVQKRLSQEGIRVYLTRTRDTALSDEDRLAIIAQVEADLYIGLGVSMDDENSDSYGILCYYNDEYFIPGFGNVQLADMVTREVATASSNRAAGLKAAGSGSLLKRITIPAAQLSLGYLSNPQECALLERESYQEKLADGILAALERSCGELGSRAAQAAE